MGTSKYSFAAILHCLLPHLFGSNAQQNPILLALFAFKLRQNPTQSCVPLVFRGALMPLRLNTCKDALLKCLSIFILLLLTACDELPWANVIFGKGGTYTITSYLDDKGNALTADKFSAEEGGKIQVKVELALGFTLEPNLVSIITDNGESVPFNGDFAPHYLTFVMPADNVTIHFEVPPEFPPLPNPLPPGMVAAFLTGADEQVPYQFYGTLQEALDTAIGATIEEPAYIFPLCDIQPTETTRISSGQHIALYTQGAQHNKIIRSSTFTTDSLFEVEAGASLVLGAAAGSSLTIDGGLSTGVTVDKALITVYGTFTMDNGTVLQNNNRLGDGGGVYVSGGSAVFTMKGGKICNNKTATGNGGLGVGAGVYVDDGAKFVMTGGGISGNSCVWIGGGVCVMNSSSVFILTGGEISGNTSNIDGGGIAIEWGKFSMSGGSVSNNSAANNGGGISAAYSAIVEISGGNISGNIAGSKGGGIRLYGEPADISPTTLNLSGGEITGNIVTSLPHLGQGVCIDSSTPLKINMSGNASIAANNDVYLPAGNYITVTGQLNPKGGTAAKITSANTTSETVVAQGSTISAYTLTSSDAAKFTHTSCQLVYDSTAPGLVKTMIFTNVTALQTWLQTQSSGGTTATAIPVVLSGIDLSNSTNLSDLFNALNTANKYVSIDLSGCNGLATWEQYLNDGVNKIVGLTMPNSVTVIGDGSNAILDLFSSLTSLNGANVLTLEDFMFQESTNLLTADFPLVTTVKWQSFYRCYALTTINLPSVTSFDAQVFNECNSLTSITLGAIPPTLGNNLFYNAVAHNVTLNVPSASIGDYTTWLSANSTKFNNVTPILAGY
ncbi:MAG: hypothetical protein Ta2B_02210 [Termitinemataceae bacterium]|nr:MAG: hypothetical protein Ta2B_02210 [Termitinemataceae bacterium]